MLCSVYFLSSSSSSSSSSSPSSSSPSSSSPSSSAPDASEAVLEDWIEGSIAIPEKEGTRGLEVVHDGGALVSGGLMMVVCKTTLHHTKPHNISPHHTTPHHTTPHHSTAARTSSQLWSEGAWTCLARKDCGSVLKE